MSWLFWLVVLLAALPHLYAAAEGLTASNLTFSVSALAWSLSPIAVPVIMALARAKSAAWGWLVAITAFGYFIFATVFVWPQGSTAAIALFWAPIWSLIIVGPLGAIIGVVVALRYEES